MMEKRCFRKKKIYISCRVTTLAAAVAQMTGYNITSRISCKVPLSDQRVSAHSHTFPLDMADHCAGPSLSSQNSLV